MNPNYRLGVQVAVETQVLTTVRIYIGVAYLAGVAAVLSAFGVLLMTAAPTPVTASSVTADASNSVKVSWTAPGDDGTIGTASQYDLRYSTASITAGNFASAIAVSGEPLPLPAGTTQSMTVTGLAASTTYYFALRTADEASNWSSISNVATKTTSAQPPASCLENWSCTNWTICSAQGSQSRLCTDANSCGTVFNKPLESQSCTPSALPPPASCLENWSCTAWSACSADGAQGRSCVDLNVCGTIASKPVENRSCTMPPPIPTAPQEVPSAPPSKEPPAPDAGGNVGPNIPYIVAAPANDGASEVHVLNAGGTVALKFRPFGRTSRGLSVAAGDIDGDSVVDIAVGLRTGPNREVRVFGTNGVLKGRLNVYPARQGAGVTLTVGDINGDGRAELLTSPTIGPPIVSAYTFSPSRARYFLLGRIVAFAPQFRGGMALTTGNISGDFSHEVVLAQGSGGQGIVRIFRYDRTRSKFVSVRQFHPYGKGFQGAISVAVGEVTGDGKADIVTVTGPGNPSLVRVSTPTGTKEREFIVSSRSYKGGARVTAVDTTNDGTDEILTSAYGTGNSQIFVYGIVGGQFVRGKTLTAFTGYRNGLVLDSYLE